MKKKFRKISIIFLGLICLYQMNLIGMNNPKKIIDIFFEQNSINNKIDYSKIINEYQKRKPDKKKSGFNLSNNKDGKK